MVTSGPGAREAPPDPVVAPGAFEEVTGIPRLLAQRNTTTPTMTTEVKNPTKTGPHVDDKKVDTRPPNTKHK